MRAVVDNWSIVLLGHWNTLIFAPDWLTRTLGGAQINIEFPVGNPFLPVRFTCNGVRIIVTQPRIVLSPMEDRSELLERMGQFATIILRTLQHTPIGSVGVNFDFEAEETSAPRLTELIRSRDASELAEANWIVESIEQKRRLRQAQDNTILNLTLRQIPGSPIGFNFNFHRDVEGAAAAAEYLTNRVIPCRE